MLLVTPVDIAVGRDRTIYVAELYFADLYATTGVFGNGSVVKLTP